MPAFPSGLESQWRQWFIFICSLYSQYPVLYLEHNLSTCLPAEVWLHIFLFYPHPCEVKKLKIREVKSELSYHRESNCHVVDSKNFFLFHRSPVFTWQSAWRYFFFLSPGTIYSYNISFGSYFYSLTSRLSNEEETCFPRSNYSRWYNQASWSQDFIF